MLPPLPATHGWAQRLVAAAVPPIDVLLPMPALPQDLETAWEAVRHAKQPRVHTFIATSGKQPARLSGSSSAADSAAAAGRIAGDSAQETRVVSCLPPCTPVGPPCCHQLAQQPFLICSLQRTLCRSISTSPVPRLSVLQRST